MVTLRNQTRKVTMTKPISVIIPRHLNEHQVADLTSLSVKTLRKMLHEMRGLPFIKLGRRVLYSEKDLALWLDANRNDNSDKEL